MIEVNFTKNRCNLNLFQDNRFALNSNQAAEFVQKWALQQDINLAQPKGIDSETELLTEIALLNKPGGVY
jgi:hypothetical protein